MLRGLGMPVGEVAMIAPINMVLNLRTLANALGGEVSGQRVLAPGPQHSPKDRSLCVSLAPATPSGFLVHSFAGDDPIACKDYVRSRLGLPAWQPGDEQDRIVPLHRRAQFDRMAVDREATKRPRTEDDLVRIKRARALWNEAIDPRGTIAVQYLKARALDLSDDVAGDVLRFHPRTPWRNENTGKTDRIPCMIAAFRSIDDDTVTGVHRIRLDQPQRWPKTERRMFGVVHRAAVKFDPVATTLIIGEGIETCMAARQLGARSTWSLGSTGGISSLPVLEGVDRLIVLGETGKASSEAIQSVRLRWRGAGRIVQARMPRTGNDLNDELIERTVQ